MAPLHLSSPHPLAAYPNISATAPPASRTVTTLGYGLLNAGDNSVLHKVSYSVAPRGGLLIGNDPQHGTCEGRVSGARPVACNHASGTVLPGSAATMVTVTCTARDTAGNVGSTSFSLTTRRPTTAGGVASPTQPGTMLSSVRRGRSVLVSAGGFRAGATVRLNWGSLVRTATAGSTGRVTVRVTVSVTVTVKVTVPSASPIGRNLVTLAGPRAGTTVLRRVLAISVTS